MRFATLVLSFKYLSGNFQFFSLFFWWIDFSAYSAVINSEFWMEKLSGLAVCNCQAGSRHILLWVCGDDHDNDSHPLTSYKRQAPVVTYEVDVGSASIYIELHYCHADCSPTIYTTGQKYSLELMFAKFATTKIANDLNLLRISPNRCYLSGNNTEEF